MCVARCSRTTSCMNLFLGKLRGHYSRVGSMGIVSPFHEPRPEPPLRHKPPSPPPLSTLAPQAIGTSSTIRQANTPQSYRISRRLYPSPCLRLYNHMKSTGIPLTLYLVQYFLSTTNHVFSSRNILANEMQAKLRVLVVKTLEWTKSPFSSPRNIFKTVYKYSLTVLQLDFTFCIEFGMEKSARVLKELTWNGPLSYLSRPGCIDSQLSTPENSNDWTNSSRAQRVGHPLPYPEFNRRIINDRPGVLCSIYFHP